MQDYVNFIKMKIIETGITIPQWEKMYVLEFMLVR